MGLFSGLFNKKKSEADYENMRFDEQIKIKERFIQVQNIVLRINEPRAIVTEEKLRSAVRMIVEDRSRIIADCVKLINTTKNPDVFLRRFDMLKEITEELSKLEPFGVFCKPYPSEQFLDIMNNYNATVNRLADRVLDDAQEKASTLKTNEAKNRKIISALSNLLSYDFPSECVDYMRAVYKEKYEPDNIDSAAFDIQMKRAKEYEIDLVEVSKNNRICGECAKYQGRIYSLSGKDKRYPKFPEYLQVTKGAHCGLQIYPFDEEFSRAVYVEGDPIQTSNRPFVDDRTPEQVELYDNYIKEQQRKENARLEYEQIVEKLPDIAPKSLGGYSKMKNNKSANYLKLVEKAAEAGIMISEE